MARIAMPLASDFEDSEFTVPYDKLIEAGHEVVVFGVKAGEKVEGKRGRAEVKVEKEAGDIDVDRFDAVVIAGGYSPDHLRLDARVVEVVQQFADDGKLVAAICHGPQLLIEADVVQGRTLTSWPSVRRDLENAGADWVDEEVVVDGNLITSRKPDDLEAFSGAILSALDRATAQRELHPS